MISYNSKKIKKSKKNKRKKNKRKEERDTTYDILDAVGYKLILNKFFIKNSIIILIIKIDDIQFHGWYYSHSSGGNICIFSVNIM